MNIKSYSHHTKKYNVLISAVHSVYRLINSTFGLKDLVVRLSRLICQIFHSQTSIVLLLDPSYEYSILKCTTNGKKASLVDKKVKLADSRVKRIVKSISSIKKSRLLGIPLVCEDLMGLILVQRNKSSAAFDKFDQEMLMVIGEQAVVGIRNLQLYEEQHKLVLGSIKSLVTLLDTRIPQEYTHSPYFSRLVSAIGHQMRLSERQIESLKFASMLHDTGKVDIPLEILTKTTKLTSQELKIIKNHPVKGAQILRHLQALKPVLPIIMYHHEKYDGTGYPSRLKKGQIPLGARIMAVADAFEAMVYGRPYRERKDIRSAIKEIKKKSGTQFDPKVVESFLKVIKKIKLKYA
ncbi:MAG: hypothetical protein DRP74_03910 [Candidatus Omnitrophota bacterium]|nr:MAG: hypothetical protein DRP74_03910 [Candidatus Omnitrophota bacterium]